MPEAPVESRDPYAALLQTLTPSVVFGGCMTLLVVAFTTWKVPELRKMDRIG